MSHNSNLENDEIDLGELIATVWSHKFLITLITGLSIFVAAYNALTSQRLFTASAIFQMEETNTNSGFNITGEFGALATLAGFTNGQSMSNANILIERASRREFILDMKEKYVLDGDPFFNDYSPRSTDPFWKATIKKMVGWKEIARDKNAVVENKVIANYKANVLFEMLETGAVLISVVHIDPLKASNYANYFMEEIRSLVERESIKAQRHRLDYLSDTLADALQDMEESKEKLKTYTLENSALAQENFISDSLKIDEIRMEKRKVKEIANLLSVIENLTKSGTLKDNSYETLRSTHPLVDDVDFRRILGMSETISAWTWPDIETLKAVKATLIDRIKRLDFQIRKLEENAKIYAKSAEDLAKYTRDAKISEATYTVLIEQVKSQSLAAGFKPETFKVFEYATPPLFPSSPNRTLFLAIGMLIGIISGIFLALLNGARKGVYYTRSRLLSDTNADVSIKSKSIRKLSSKSIHQIKTVISKSQTTELGEADLKLSGRKIIFVMNAGGKPTAPNAARLLATQGAQSGRNVVLCDTTGQLKKEVEDKGTRHSSGFPIENVSENISVMGVAKGSSFFTSKAFNATIKDLAKRFDQIFIYTDTGNAQLGLIALLEFSPTLVMISGLRRTKKSYIKIIKSRQPIDLLFYD